MFSNATLTEIPIPTKNPQEIRTNNAHNNLANHDLKYMGVIDMCTCTYILTMVDLCSIQYICTVERKVQNTFVEGGAHNPML